VEAGPAPPFAEAWRFPVAPSERDEGVSAPVIVGDTVVAVTPDAVVGLALDDGSERWSVPRDGPPSAPAVAGGTVLYLDGRTPDTASLAALSMETLEPPWDPVPLEAVGRSGVTVEGGRAFAGNAEGTIVAVDVATGELDWTADLAGEAKGPIAAGDGHVFVAPLPHSADDPLGAAIVALDAETGEQAWDLSPQVPSGISSLPVVDGGTVAIAYGDGSAYGFATDDGEQLWRVPVFAPASSFVAPALAGTDLFVADLVGGLWRIDTATRSRSWLFHFNEGVLRSSPVVAGDHVLLGLQDGSLGAVRADDGHLVWRSAPSPGLVGAIAIGGDTVVVQKGGGDGGLVAFRTDPGAALTDILSPTVPRYGEILGGFALALVIVGGALLVPLTLVSRRVGPPDLSPPDEDEDDDEDEG
jgi:outer membrane protein assembly factor BamB